MLIYSHRGVCKDYPEQSRESYLQAITDGADGFECDLRLTKDQELICWHDSDTLRLTGKKLKISTSTYDQLSFAKPLLFSELYRLAVENKKDLAVETKHPVISGGAVERELMRLISDYQGIKVEIMSFSKRAIKTITSNGFVGVDLVKNKFGLYFANAPIIGPGLDLLKKEPTIVKRAHSDGKLVYVWTVNSDEDVKFCADLGVDAIMSDNPAQARRVLGYS